MFSKLSGDEDKHFKINSTLHFMCAIFQTLCTVCTLLVWETSVGIRVLILAVKRYTALAELHNARLYSINQTGSCCHPLSAGISDFFNCVSEPAITASRAS